jgi:DNA polymerase elongation subunit (family B)
MVISKLNDESIDDETDIVILNSSLRLDAEYYITKQIIPALERIFNLCGVGKYW